MKTIQNSSVYLQSADVAVETFFPLLSILFIAALLFIWRGRNPHRS